jgi:sigma54-dependent transcription regulator
MASLAHRPVRQGRCRQLKSPRQLPAGGFVHLNMQRSRAGEALSLLHAHVAHATHAARHSAAAAMCMLIILRSFGNHHFGGQQQACY